MTRNQKPDHPAKPKTTKPNARLAKVRELFVTERIRTAEEIATRLLADGALESRSLASAIRLVEKDLEKVRSEIKTEDAEVEATGTTTEKARYLADMMRLRERALREMQLTETTSASKTEMKNAAGQVTSVVTTAKRADRAAINRQWAAILLEASTNIAKVHGIILDGRLRPDPERPPVGGPAGRGGRPERPRLFTILTPDATFEEALARNLGERNDEPTN